MRPKKLWDKITPQAICVQVAWSRWTIWRIPSRVPSLRSLSVTNYSRTGKWIFHHPPSWLVDFQKNIELVQDLEYRQSHEVYLIDQSQSWETANLFHECRELIFKYSISLAHQELFLQEMLAVTIFLIFRCLKGKEGRKEMGGGGGDFFVKSMR